MAALKLLRSDPRSITIVGLGLIGGSLAAASRKKFPHARIIGVTRNAHALAKAKKRGWIHEGYRNLDDAFTQKESGPGSDPFCLVVLCTPVNTLKDFLLRIDRVAPRGTIVTDAGSVKGFLVRWADARKWNRIQFVGAHPMAGSHEQGIDAAKPDLFARALTFITPGRRTQRPALRSAVGFWKKICAKSLVVSAETHDRLTAQISHVPHLLASILVESVSSKSLQVAASGFLDTTRIAKSDSGLWTPIFLENRKEIGRALKKIESNLKRLEYMLKTGKAGHLRAFLTRAKQRRSGLEKSP